MTETKTEIKLYNTRTRKREVFTPLDPTNVRMYVCGPTVYDRAHIGNARPVVVFDVLFRLLRHVYGEDHVTYVRNFTDIDDKINARAAETRQEGETTLEAIRRITDETTRWYLEDMDALGALRPTHMPRATEYVPQMIAMIEALVAGGYAYEAEGHVLFDVSSWPEYGSFSRRSMDELISGSRVEVAPYKKSPMDFVLWKPSDDDTPGWDSPWGRGRPGWHIECSAMSEALLGKTFDIHGGGIDLQFPHHENEIAQSCCANHTEWMANVWMHNGFLQVEGEKMAKSAGNFFTVKDLLDKGIPGEVIRFVLLSTHYRQPLDWTEKRVEEAEKTLRKWRTLCHGVKSAQWISDLYLAHLMDDLNTPACIADLHRLARMGDASGLLSAGSLLGLLTPEMGGWFELGSVPVSENEDLNRIIELRNTLRANKEWALADSLRDRLNDLGVVISDGKDGSSGYIEPEFLMRDLMSEIAQAYQSGDPLALDEAVERARSAGIAEPLSGGLPRAWSSNEAKALTPYIERELKTLRAEMELAR